MIINMKEFKRSLLDTHRRSVEHEQMLKFSKYENEILDLIDNRDELTRSDLQGAVSALVRKIANNYKK